MEKDKDFMETIPEKESNFASRFSSETKALFYRFLTFATQKAPAILSFEDPSQLLLLETAQQQERLLNALISFAEACPEERKCIPLAIHEYFLVGKDYAAEVQVSGLSKGKKSDIFQGTRDTVLKCLVQSGTYGEHNDFQEGVDKFLSPLIQANASAGDRLHPILPPAFYSDMLLILVKEDLVDPVFRKDAVRIEWIHRAFFFNAPLYQDPSSFFTCLNWKGTSALFADWLLFVLKECTSFFYTPLQKASSTKDLRLFHEWILTYTVFQGVTLEKSTAKFQTLKRNMRQQKGTPSNYFRIDKNNCFVYGYSVSKPKINPPLDK
jgi:hypothetical protein